MTSLDFGAARLTPLSGARGWLARSPGLVLWAPDCSSAAEQFIAGCLAADGPTDLLGRLGRSLADPAVRQWPPFAVVASRQDELVVLVNGPVEVRIEREGGDDVWRGGDESGSWASRGITGARRVSAGLDAASHDAVPSAGDVNEGTDEGHHDTPAELANLGLGVIRADGFVLVLGARPSAPAPAFDYQGAPTQAPVAGKGGILSLANGGPERPSGPAEAGPQPSPGGGRTELAPPGAASSPAPTVVEDRPGPEDVTVVQVAVDEADVTLAEGPASVATNGAAASGPTLSGVYCSKGHFNDPRARSCAQCGGRIGSGARRVDGPRPALGTLHWDDGEVSELGQGAVVGRDVAADPDVNAGRLLAVMPHGLNDSMSRVHAELRPAGWDVTVTDRGSTNGTFIWDETSRCWQRLVPGEAQVVAPGSVLAFGERTATLDR